MGLSPDKGSCSFGCGFPFASGMFQDGYGYGWFQEVLVRVPEGLGSFYEISSHAGMVPEVMVRWPGRF